MSSGYESIYRIFGLEAGASLDRVKKRYHLYALKYHPDRAPDDIKARRKFEIATEAYKIIVMLERRKKNETRLTGSKKWVLFNINDYADKKQGSAKRGYVTKKILTNLEYNDLLDKSRNSFKRFLNSVEKIKK